MSPILVRPVREQLEHDRVIRLLQAKYKRKFEVAINPGSQQLMPVGTPPSQWYPDLVLQSQERTHKLVGVVEVETAESVNHLEAMSQWAALSKLRAPFHLYVPVSCVDSSRRLAADLSIPVAELWAYQAIGDQIRFTLVQRTDVPEARAPRQPAEPAAPRPAALARAAAAAPRPAATARRAAKPAAAPRTRTARKATATPARRPTTSSAAGSRRKPATKTKTASSRRPAAAKAVGRKASGSARAQKRR